MPVRIKPTSVIKAKLGLQENGYVQSFFVSECAREMDRFVPMDEGNLRLYKIDGRFINYNQPYAEIQYYGIINGKPIPEDHYTTPGTGPYWDKKMWTAKGDDITKRVQRLFGGK